MATTYTSHLKLRLPSIGQASWGDEIIDDIEIVDFALGGMFAGNVTLSGCAPSDGGGLVIDYAGGEVSVNGTRYTIASGSKTCTAEVKNYLCVDASGVVQIYTTAPTAAYAALAVVDAGTASIDRFADLRKLAEGAAAFDIAYSPTNYAPDTGESKEIEQHLAGIDNQMGHMSGFKNLLINPGFTIAQRGTSFTGMGNGDRQYTLDRWEFIETGTITGELDVIQSSDHPYGAGHSLRIDTATAQASFATTDDLRIVQHIEGQNAQPLRFGNAAARPITVGFWVKSNVTGTHSFTLWQTDPATSRGAIGEFTILAADTWEYKSFTLPGDTAGQIDNDNDIGLQFIYSAGGGTDRQSATVGSWFAPVDFKTRSTNSQNLLASTSNYIAFTEIQLEVGEVATPFEHRPFSLETILCQRYFEKSFDIANAPADNLQDGRNLNPMVAYGSSVAQCQNYFKVRKRANPTTYQFFQPGTQAGSPGLWSYYTSSTWIALSTTALARSTEVGFRTNTLVGGLSSGNAYLLSGHWTADAEL